MSPVREFLNNMEHLLKAHYHLYQLVVLARQISIY